MVFGSGLTAFAGEVSDDVVYEETVEDVIEGENLEGYTEEIPEYTEEGDVFETDGEVLYESENEAIPEETGSDAAGDTSEGEFIGVDDVYDIDPGVDFDVLAGVTALVDGESAPVSIIALDATDAAGAVVEANIVEGMLKNPVEGDTYKVTYQGGGLTAVRTIKVKSITVTVNNSLTAYVGAQSDLMHAVSAFDADGNTYQVYVTAIKDATDTTIRNDRAKVGKTMEASVSPLFTPEKEGTYTVDYTVVNTDNVVLTVRHRNVFAVARSSVKWRGVENTTIAAGQDFDLLNGVGAVMDDGAELSISVSGIELNGARKQAVSKLIPEEGTYVITYAASLNGKVMFTTKRTLSVSGVPVSGKLSLKGNRSTALDNKVTDFGEFYVEFADGGEWNADKNAYIWTAPNDASGHMYIFRIIFSTSGIGDLEPGEIKLRIPKQILRDADGNFADTYYFAIPKKSDAIAHGTQAEYVYSEDGDDIVIENWLATPAATNGYIEVGYITSKNTYYYTDMSVMDPFHATITASGLEKNSNEILVGINTRATINSVDIVESGVHLIRNWNSSWGAKPADADDYLYLSWPITTYINPPSQYYTLGLQNTVTSPNGTPEIVGLIWNGSAIVDESTKVTLQLGRQRSATLITRHPKSEFENLTSYTITDKVVATVHPQDGVDPDTTATDRATFVWTKPVFNPPTGHFQARKFGNENWGYDHYRNYYYRAGGTGYANGGISQLQAQRIWDYASYDLNFLQNDYENENQPIGGIKYVTWGIGYPYPWTVPSGHLLSDPHSYDDNLRETVTYTLSDETLYLINPKDSTKVIPDEDVSLDGEIIEKLERENKLGSEDYDFQYLYYYIDMMTATYVETLDKIGFNTSKHVYDENDILSVYVKPAGSTDYVLGGKICLGNGSTSDVNNAYITELTRQYVGFTDGIDGWRMEVTNAHYMTSFIVAPFVKLYPTEKVMSLVHDDGTLTGNPLNDVLLYNRENFTVDDNNNMGTASESVRRIFDVDRIIGDRLRRSEKRSSLDKKISGSVVRDPLRQRYTFSWTVTEQETITTGTGEIAYIPQEGGTFYDLIPIGGQVDLNSVSVRGSKAALDKTDFTVELIPNYKNSGRQMLIVRISKTDDYFTLTYRTVHSYEEVISLRDGRIYNAVNPVAYETGNASITNGYPDNAAPLASGNEENYNLMKGLDDPNMTAKKFLYDEELTSVSDLIAVWGSLDKKVMASGDKDFSYDTTTTNGGVYTYLFRYKSVYGTKTSNMVWFDSFENYKPQGIKESEWRGKLEAVDMAALEHKGIAPVVYLSSVENLDLDVAENHDLTNTAVWTKMSEFGDLGNAKAIAIDMRKSKTGEDYVLPENELIRAVMYFRAPSTLPPDFVDKGRYPETYNNIYMQNKVTHNRLGVSKDYYIRQDYTTVRYKVIAKLNLHKVNAENPNMVIPGMTFKLSGTSDYGTVLGSDYEKMTNAEGNLVFDNIEQGTYTLQETKTNDDWLLDSTPHTVQVKNDGTIWVDDVECTNVEFVAENNPRIHGDVTFMKVDLKDKTKLRGAKFVLTGTSEYGTPTTMYATSGMTEDGIQKQNGLVEFNNIEMGTYELREVVAPGISQNGFDYIKNSNKYQVIVERSGDSAVVNIYLLKEDGTKEALLPNNKGEVEITNERYHEFAIHKKSSYQDAPIDGVQFHLWGTSDNGTPVDMTKTTVGGNLSFKGLEPGAYSLQETFAPEGYVKDDTVHGVVIDNLGNTTITGIEFDNTKNAFTFVNTKLADGRVIVIKKWKDDVENPEDRPVPVIHISATAPTYTSHQVPIWSVDNADYPNAGNVVNRVPLQVFDEDGFTKEEWTWTSDNGEAKNLTLPVGTYTVKQNPDIAMPEGYKLIAPVTFTLNEDGTITIGENTVTQVNVVSQKVFEVPVLVYNKPNNNPATPSNAADSRFMITYLDSASNNQVFAVSAYTGEPVADSGRELIATGSVWLTPGEFGVILAGVPDESNWRLSNGDNYLLDGNGQLQHVESNGPMHLDYVDVDAIKISLYIPE